MLETDPNIVLVGILCLKNKYSSSQYEGLLYRNILQLLLKLVNLLIFTS